MIQRMHIAIVMMMVGAMLGGCKSGEQSAGKAVTGNEDAARASVETGTLIPQAHPPVEDVPVPMGFKLVESVSKGFESTGAREIDHTYQGRADKLDVQRFYDVQMIVSGWTRREKQLDDGEFKLTFEKAGEAAVVVIDWAPRLEGERTSVNIKVKKQ